MKNFIILAFLLLYTLFIIEATTAVNNHVHLCYDISHEYCDGLCNCDGIECTTSYKDKDYPGFVGVSPRHYQLHLDDSSRTIYIYDMQCIVDTISYDNNLNLSILKQHNE